MRDRITRASRVRLGLIAGCTLALAALGAAVHAESRRERLRLAHEETARAVEAYDRFVASPVSPSSESARLDAVRARVRAVRELGPSEEDEALLAGLDASLESVAEDAREIARLDAEAREARSELAELEKTARSTVELEENLGRCLEHTPRIDPGPQGFDSLQREVETLIRDIDHAWPRCSGVVGEDAEPPAIQRN